MFRVAPPSELKKLEALLRHKVFRTLLPKRKVNPEMVTMLSRWRHSGFHVSCGSRITAMENLARYITGASFSQERMTHMDQDGKVVCAAKEGESRKIFPPWNGWQTRLPTSRTGARRW